MGSTFLSAHPADVASEADPGARQTPAVSATDFLDSIGANSAVSRRGESLASTIDCVTYLGLRWLRAGYESDIPVADLIELHSRTGVRFSYGLASGGTDIVRLLNGARQLAAAGALLALEGSNEPNNWGIAYQGEEGGRDLTWLPVARLQRDLYDAVKRDPVLRVYPVWSISENGAETDNVGLQFLTIPNGAGTLMPSGTQYADYANCHNCMTHPGWPGLHDNQTWIAADPTSACRADGLHGNYGLTWRHHHAGYAEPELLALPRVATETGVTVEGPTTEQVQASLYLTVYLDQFKRGWEHTAIYLLRDRTDEGGNQTFGFFRPDYTPRPAATYLHNLTAILAGNSPLPTPSGLGYSITDQPATVHDLLLRKSDGTFELIVWNERLVGSDNVTVDLGATFASVTVYDPTIGTSPVGNLSDVGSVALTLSDHPVIIEIPARAAAWQRRLGETDVVRTALNSAGPPASGPPGSGAAPGWERRGLILSRPRTGDGSDVVGDPCVVWDDEIRSWRMFLFLAPPGTGEAVCETPDDPGPGRWRLLGPLKFANPSALAGGATHKPFIVMDARHPNRAARVDGRFWLLCVSYKGGSKVVQRAFSEELAGPWTIEDGILIDTGGAGAFYEKHVDAVTGFWFEDRDEFLYFYMGIRAWTRAAP